VPAAPERVGIEGGKEESVRVALPLLPSTYPLLRHIYSRVGKGGGLVYYG